MRLSQKEFQRYFANPLMQRIAREEPTFRYHIRRIRKLGLQATPEAVRELSQYLPIPPFPDTGDDETKRQHVIMDILAHAAIHALVYVGDNAIQPLLEVCRALPTCSDRRKSIIGVIDCILDKGVMK
jgi:hypothetical protein